MSDQKAVCQLCGEPMPAGEEMFNYHGYSGPCPKPPLAKTAALPEPGAGAPPVLAWQEDERKFIARIANAVDRRTGTLAQIAENVEGLRQRYNEMCDRLQACVQRHHLGLGGEQVDELVVNELERLASCRVPAGPTVAYCVIDRDGYFTESDVYVCHANDVPPTLAKHNAEVDRDDYNKSVVIGYPFTVRPLIFGERDT